MSCPFNPLSLFNKVRTIGGFVNLPFANMYLLEEIDDVCEAYSDWDEGQGFGSSDMTYAVKSCIDNIILKYFNGEYETVFNPCLTVIKK